MGATATFIAGVVDGANLTTYTFTSAAIGTSSPDRIVVVCAVGAVGSVSPTISSVTVGGNTATVLSQTTMDSTATLFVTAGIAAIAVPTSSTATIVVAFSSGMARAAIEVYSVTGAIGIGPFNTSTVASSTGTSLTRTIVSPTEGCVIGITVSNGAGAVPTGFTWTNTTEDADTLVEVGTRVGAAHTNFTTGSTNLTISSCATGGTGEFVDVMVLATFAPSYPTQEFWDPLPMGKRKAAMVPY